MDMLHKEVLLKKLFTHRPSPNTLKKTPARTAAKDRMLPPPEKNWDCFSCPINKSQRIS